MLRAWQGLKDAITSGMDPRLYELATVAAATAIRSSYCSLVHGRILATRYYPAEQVVRIAENDEAAALDAADAAVVRFARKVAEEAENITQEDVDELGDLGFSDADVFNVSLASAARCFFSKAVDATGTLPRRRPSGHTGSAAVRPDRGPGGCPAGVIRAALGSWS